MVELSSASLSAGARDFLSQARTVTATDTDTDTDTDTATGTDTGTATAAACMSAQHACHHQGMAPAPS